MITLISPLFILYLRVIKLFPNYPPAQLFLPELLFNIPRVMFISREVLHYHYILLFTYRDQMFFLISMTFISMYKLRFGNFLSIC